MKTESKKSENQIEANNTLANRIILDTPNAEHVLYAIDTLSKIYFNELKGNEPLDLSDITTPWESIDEAADNFDPFPEDQEIEALAIAHERSNKEDNYKPSVKPDDYIAAVVSKYFKTKGKQRNCLIVQQAFRSKLIELCRINGLRMPKSKVTPEAWTKDWEPSTFKFDAKTGKALVIEGFEHLFKLLSRITHDIYHSYRVLQSLEMIPAQLSA